MIDIGSMAAVAGSLKTAGEIAKAMVGLRDAAVVQSKVIELQGVIMSAQSSALTAQSDQFALLERVRELEAQMAELEAWESEKQRYELKDYGGGTFAYELKEPEVSGEPPHRICAACYQKGQKSILQFSHISQANHRHIYDCNVCETRFSLAS